MSIAIATNCRGTCHHLSTLLSSYHDPYCALCLTITGPCERASLIEEGTKTLACVLPNVVQQVKVVIWCSDPSMSRIKVMIGFLRCPGPGALSKSCTLTWCIWPPRAERALVAPGRVTWLTFSSTSLSSSSGQTSDHSSPTDVRSG